MSHRTTPFLQFAKASRKIADSRGIPLPSLADLRSLYNSEESEGWRWASIDWLHRNARSRETRQSRRSRHASRNDPGREANRANAAALRAERRALRERRASRRRAPLSARCVDRRRGAYAISKYGKDVKYLRAHSEQNAIARYLANPHAQNEWG